MARLAARFLAAFVLFAGVSTLASAQDGKDAPRAERSAADDEYRQFFKKPQTVLEFWSAMQFELEVGRTDLAAAHLRGLMALKPSATDLFKLGDTVGMAPILRLRNIRPWVPVPRYDEKGLLDEIARLDKEHAEPERIAKARADVKRKKAYEDAVQLNRQANQDVEDLINQTSAAVRKVLNDPQRIKRYVANLTASPEEKAYALKELYRSGGAVAPYLLDAWKAAGPAERPTILEAMRRLGPDILPGLAAALDSDDTGLKLDLIHLFRQRGAFEMAPHLWFLTASPAQPESVRRAALAVLSAFLDTPASKLPPAKVALTREADRYYRHAVTFTDPRAVTVWQWDGARPWHRRCRRRRRRSITASATPARPSPSTRLTNRPRSSSSAWCWTRATSRRGLPGRWR